MFKDFPSYHAWARGTIDARLDKDADLIHFSDFMRYMIKGGKRLRGTLCLLISQALGGDSEESLPYACAIEMVHAATLAHDDFIDGHGTRRGRIPLYRVLDPRRAVLLADMLLSTSAHRVASLGSTDGYQTLTKAIYEVSRGVFYEPLNPVPFIREIRSGKIEKRLYRVLIRLKTAELFGAACKLGAIAAGADVSDRLRAYSYGIAVGEAFQVADDLVDILIARKKGTIDKATAIKLLPTMLYLSKDVIGEMVKDVMRRAPSIDALNRVDTTKLEVLINSKTQEARKVAGAFPRSEYRDLLEHAPQTVVSLMLKEAG